MYFFWMRAILHRINQGYSAAAAAAAGCSLWLLLLGHEAAVYYCLVYPHICSDCNDTPPLCNVAAISVS